jgi:hypothetical protein
MKINISPKAKQLGNTLLIALTISAFLGICITGYLSVAEQQNYLSSRSQAWNMAIAITEAGVEEGLQQLNVNSANLASDGWTYVNNYYFKSNSLTDGNSYTITMFVTNILNPVIIARSYTLPPQMTQNSATSRSAFLAAAGVNISSAAVVTRAIKVTAAKGNLFTAAMVAKHGIDLKGNGVYTDSFNSQDPTKSTNGKYDSNKYSGDKGDIATNGGVGDTVGVGNANVYGKVHTGANGSVSFLPNGAVGPHGSQTSDLATAIGRGYVLQDSNFTFPDTTYPNTSSYLPLPPGGTVVTTSFTYNTNGVSGATVYPSPAPWGGVTTNTTPTTVNNLPNPLPPGLTTNAIPVTSSNLPNPVVAGTITNLTTQYTTNSSYPSAGSYSGTPTTNYTTYPVTANTPPLAGTYVGTVTVNVVTSGPVSGRGTWYTYNQITSTSYAYNLITGMTYTYNTYTYTYPVYTYNYNTYTTNSVLTTNVYDHIFAANTSYVTDTLTGKCLVAGPYVTLAIRNGLNGAESLTWQQGASLLVFSGGTAITVSGSGYTNPNGSAASLIIYAAPTVTSFTLNGNGQFTGVLVAPSADIDLNGSGNANEDFCGSLMVNSAKFNGHFSFHYDEALLNSAANGRYLATSWNEVP